MIAAVSKIIVAGLGIVCVTAAASAQDALVDATQPERILAVARGFGSAELEKDKSGDPRISGRIDGARYSVFFYGCKDGTNCRTIQFHNSFEVRKKPTLAAINAYNQKNRFGKVYTDKDGDPALEFDVNLDGGASPKLLDDTFDWWKVILANFRKSFSN